MWLYFQSSGSLWSEVSQVGQGYSGFGDGKNNPEMQNILDIGPIPQGQYQIGEPEESLQLGPCAIPLLALAGNAMFGRSGFFMHGDSIVHPGMASHGCIIMLHDVRLQVAASTDKILEVQA